jgi:anti-anti-sigma factor
MAFSRPFASPLLDVQIVPRGPDVVVRAAGELDISTAPLLLDAVECAVDGVHPPAMVLDLTRLRFCDASGLRVVVATWRRIHQARGRMTVVVEPDGPVARILKVTDMNRLLLIRSRVEGATNEGPEQPGRVAGQEGDQRVRGDGQGPVAS